MEKAYIVEMFIVEIPETDVISINKTMTKQLIKASKASKDQHSLVVDSEISCLKLAPQRAVKIFS